MEWKSQMNTSWKSNTPYRTCVSVAEPTPQKTAQVLTEALKKSDYAEVRLDYLDSGDEEAGMRGETTKGSLTAKAAATPPMHSGVVAETLEAIKGSLDRTVCTLRPVAGGGRFRGSEEERIKALSLIAWYKPFLLDVEFETLQRFPILAKLIKSAGTRLLVSWHDFNGTPDAEKLQAQMDAMSEHSSWIKLACMAESNDDASRMLALYGRKGDRHLISFAMGDHGSASRILCLYLGSPYTYVSLGRAVAPGQIDVDRMRKIISGKC